MPNGFPVEPVPKTCFFKTKIFWRSPKAEKAFFIFFSFILKLDFYEWN